MISLFHIAKNTAAMLMGTLIRMAASFILFIIIARRLGAEGMGKFSIVLTLFWLFQTVASMGIQPLLVREVAKDRSRAGLFLSHASIGSGIAGAAMALIMIATSYLLGYPGDVIQSTWWAGIALFFSTLTIVPHAIFIAFEKNECVLAGMTLENGIKLLFGLVVLYGGKGIVWLTAVYAGSYMLAYFFSLLWSRNQGVWFYPQWQGKLFRWLIREIPTFAGISLFNTLFWNANVVLLSKMASIEAVGLFSAAYRIVNMVKLVLQSYKVAIQPVAAKTFESSEGSFRSFCHQSLRLIFLLTIPACVGGTVFARPLLLFLFGPEFLEAVLLFKITLWMLLFYGIVLVLATFLIAAGYQRYDLTVNIVSTLVSVGLHVLLIHFWQALGAAIALVASVFFFFLMQTIYVRRLLFPIPYGELALRFFLASCGFWIVSLLLSTIHFAIQMGIGVLLYFGILFLFRGVSVTDFQTLLTQKERGS